MTEMTHFHFPKIPEYSKLMSDVRRHCQYNQLPLPKLVFTGTTKLHGTNAGVVMSLSDPDTIWGISRDQVVSADLTLAGFYDHVQQYRAYFKRLLKRLSVEYQRDHHTHVAIWGEWAGAGVINSSAAINKIAKNYYIFSAALITDNGPDKESIKDWINPKEVKQWVNACSGIGQIHWHILDFPHRTIEIDFNRADTFQTKLVEMAQKVEKCCPVASRLGQVGVGEGMAWCYTGPDFIPLYFKVKGQKHSKSHVRVTHVKDDAKLSDMYKFVESVATSERMQDIADKMALHNLPAVYSNMGEFIKRVCQDIHTEESWRCDALGLTWKECTAPITRVARTWWANNCTETPTSRSN
jgi:hypothetical protein